MPEYEWVQRFSAADDAQAERLALAWSDTCAAEYGARLEGVWRIGRHGEPIKPNLIGKGSS